MRDAFELFEFAEEIFDQESQFVNGGIDVERACRSLWGAPRGGREGRPGPTNTSPSTAERLMKVVPR